MNKRLSDIEPHSAGATVRHTGRFDELKTYKNKEDISQEFRNVWVLPYYMNLGANDSDWIKQIVSVKEQITDEIVLKNLGNFNWRSRSTGSFFASIKESVHFTDIIGTHLLKSEVCYAGKEYAKTLAIFNTNQSLEYLITYLDYYLTRVDFWFDQTYVLKAVKYLDKVNGTSFSLDKKEQWLKFKKGQHDHNQNRIEKLSKEYDLPMDKINSLPNESKWEFELSLTSFEKNIETIEKIKSSSF